MALKKVNRDPFSNGTEYEWWDARNCLQCVKAIHVKRGSGPDYPDYTKSRCAIERDIYLRMHSDKPISQRTIDICQQSDCPFRQEHYKKYPRRPRKNEPTLF